MGTAAEAWLDRQISVQLMCLAFTRWLPLMPGTTKDKTSRSTVDSKTNMKSFKCRFAPNDQSPNESGQNVVISSGDSVCVKHHPKDKSEQSGKTNQRDQVLSPRSPRSPDSRSMLTPKSVMEKKQALLSLSPRSS